MTPADLRLALPDAFAPRLPRSRAGLAGRLRALSAARLSVAILLGGGGQPISTDLEGPRSWQRPPIEREGRSAA